MSERDLQLKLLCARYFWALGCVPVLRVRLTAYGSSRGGMRKGRNPTLTDLADLDVLGIETAGDFVVRYRAAECKSARAGAKELFWLRGVLEYFGGGDGYLVVQHDDLRTPALRELASRLRLGILTFNDFAALEAGYPRDEVASVIFSPEAVAHHDALLSSPSKALERLTDYTMRSYWQLPHHRNLQQTIGYLRSAGENLDSRQRAHVVLFGELVMRYMLALYALCGAILRRGVPHARDSTLAFLHGGELGLLEAQQRVRAVATFQQELEGGARLELSEAFSEAPAYFPALLDLVDRLLRRPALATAALRQLVVAVRGHLVAEDSSAQLLSGADPVATKLVNDVATFLTRSARLDRGLRDRLADAFEDSEPTPEALDSRAATAAKLGASDRRRSPRAAVGDAEGRGFQQGIDERPSTTKPHGLMAHDAAGDSSAVSSASESSESESSNGEGTPDASPSAAGAGGAADDETKTNSKKRPRVRSRTDKSQQLSIPDDPQ